MPIDVRVANENDREVLHELREQAFSDQRSAFDIDLDRAKVPLDRQLVATDRGAVVGTLGVWELGQWFGGRQVPMGGVCAVAVEPAHRGRGVASALIRVALEAMRARGEALSTLFPMNNTLYRSHGWEVAAAYPQHEVAACALRDLPRPDRKVELRKVTDDDLPVLRELHQRVAAGRAGNIWLNERFAARRMLSASRESDAYVAEIDGEPTGSVTIVHEPSWDRDERYSLLVRHVMAADRDTELALWRLLGSHHPVARTVRFVAPPQHTLAHLFGEREIRPAASSGGYPMTRLVDTSAAIGGRGFPDSAEAEVHLAISDRSAPWNAGNQVLRVSDGKGVLEPGGTGSVEVGVGHLAAMYTGWVDPRRLADWGLLAGAAAADVEALVAVFGGPMPWLDEFF